MKTVEIYSLGENAVTINFGSEISSGINKTIIGLDRQLNSNPFPGLIETVPAYASLTVFFDVLQVRKNFNDFPTAGAAVRNLVAAALEKAEKPGEKTSHPVEIPVYFADEYALDLEFVAETKNLTKDEIIEIFTGRTYRVFMLGFLPGFAYMGETDEKIRVPRRESPRTNVPKGSVGIAGRQTGIYPFASPGGWQIIGRTNLELFTPDKENPTLLQTGDLVKFYPAREVKLPAPDKK